MSNPNVVEELTAHIEEIHEQLKRDEILVSSAHETIMNLSKLIQKFESYLHCLFKKPELLIKYKTVDAFLESDECRDLDGGN